MFLYRSENANDDSEDSDAAYKPTNYTYYKTKQTNQPPITITLNHSQRRQLIRKTTRAATRYKTSSATHLGVMISTLNALGIDPKQITASHATAKRHRKQAQKAEAKRIKKKFKENLPNKLVLHWDGKVTQFLGKTGITTQDVNAVVVTSPLEIAYQFLGAPVLKDGATGRNLADATVRVLTD